MYLLKLAIFTSFEHTIFSAWKISSTQRTRSHKSNSRLHGGEEVRGGEGRAVLICQTPSRQHNWVQMVRGTKCQFSFPCIINTSNDLRLGSGARRVCHARFTFLLGTWESRHGVHVTRKRVIAGGRSGQYVNNVARTCQKTTSGVRQITWKTNASVASIWKTNKAHNLGLQAHGCTQPWYFN